MTKTMTLNVSEALAASNDRIQIAVRVIGEDFWTSEWRSRAEFLEWVRPPDSQMTEEMTVVLVAFLTGRPCP
jgi:hypothetical protein